MSRNTTLAGRLREVLLNGRWIANTNYKEQLLSVSRMQATQKVGNLNTIALLTYHINYYLEGLNNVFKTGKLEISDKYSFDLPPIKSDMDWEKLVGTFLSNAEEFAGFVENIPEAQLEEIFVDEKYGTYQRNIEAVIEHSYYRLGKISLIKKLIIA